MKLVKFYSFIYFIHLFSFIFHSFLFYFILDVRSLIERNDIDKFHLILSSSEAMGIIQMKSHIGETLLHCSVQHDRLDITKLLIENGCCVDDGDTIRNTIAHYASHFNSLECLQYLCKNFNYLIPIKNAYGNTCLHVAVHRNSLSSFRLLLQYNADASVKDGDGHTPLEAAKLKNFQDIVKELQKVNRMFR